MTDELHEPEDLVVADDGVEKSGPESGQAFVLPPALQGMAEAMRADVVPSPRIEAIGERLGARLEAPMAQAGWGLGALSGLLAIGLGAVAIGFYVFSTPEAPSSPATPPQAPVSAPTASPSSQEPDPPPPQPEPLLEPSSDIQVEPRARSRAPASAARTTSRRPPPTGIRPNREERAPSAPAATVTNQGAPSQLMEEARLLRNARQAVQGSPRDALASLAEHTQHFPQGLLVEEREFLRVVALARLGRRSQARRVGEAFLQRFARSGHRAEVTRLLRELAESSPGGAGEQEK